VDIHFLKWLELTRDRQCTAQGSAFDASYCGGRHVSIGVYMMNACRLGRAAPEPNPSQQPAREERRCKYPFFIHHQ
jgi:hypothetical protein